MNSALHRYATPFITGLFLISLISGFALFFHLGTSTFREMHEWLSVVLVLPFVLHVWKNWRAMANYFSKPAFAIATGISLLAAGGFAVQSLGETGRAGGPPQIALVSALMKNTAGDVAPLFGYTPEGLVGHLKAAGFTTATAGDTLADIATTSAKDSFAMAAALLPAAK